MFSFTKILTNMSFQVCLEIASMLCFTEIQLRGVSIGHDPKSEKILYFCVLCELLYFSRAEKQIQNI